MASELKSLPAALKGPLRRLQARCLTIACARGAGLAVLVVLCGAIATGWADLIVTLPSGLRLAAALSLLCAALALVVSAAVAASRRGAPRKLASVLDVTGRTGGQIQAGLELAQIQDVQQSGALTLDLSRRAIARAAELAARQNLAAAQPAAPALRPLMSVLLVLALIGAAWAIWPELIAAQAARVLDPTGNHPKPSPYVFNVKPSIEAVLFGDPFDVAVTVKGAEPSENFEWMVVQPGAKAWRMPLIARADGTLSGSLSAVVSDFDFFIIGPRGQSKQYHIGVINVPQIRETGARIVFPPYTGLPPFEGPFPPGGASGVSGTKITLFIASNRPLSGGRIELRATGSDQAPALPAAASAVAGDRAPNAEKLKNIEMQVLAEKDARVASGTFEISCDLSFSATVRDTDGWNSAPFLGRCVMLPDQKPRISILEPMAQSFATADISLPVIIEAEDDFGVGEVLLFRSLNGSADISTPVPLAGENLRKLRLQQELPLGEWALEPGDIIELSALARDNDPAGAKSAQTPVHRVTIITKEQYQNLLRQQETIDDLHERYQPWLNKLAELRQHWQEARQSKDPKKIAETRQALRESVEQLEAQLKEPEVFSADQQFSKELRGLADSLKQAGEDIDRGNYDEVDHRLGTEAASLHEKLELPLETLTKLYRLIENEALYTVLAQVQEDIARRAKRFADQKELDAQDMRDLKSLYDEQHEVRQALQRLLQDIRDHAGCLPDNDERFKELKESANDFATQAHDLEIDKTLDKAESAMEANKGGESHQHAQKGAEQMMSLVKKCCAKIGGQAGEGIGKFGPHLTETVNQLLGARGLPGLNSKGGGAGYSMGGGNSRVGVYGSKAKTRRGGGNGTQRGNGGGGGSSGERMEDPAGFGMQNQFDDGSSAGGAISALPGKYRSAVRDFYRRVADDLERKR